MPDAICPLEDTCMPLPIQRDQLYHYIIGRSIIESLLLKNNSIELQICTVHKTKLNKRCTTIHTNWNGTLGHISRLATKVVAPDLKKKKKKKEKHFARLATFWFGTFAMLFSATGCAVHHENTRR